MDPVCLNKWAAAWCIQGAGRVPRILPQSHVISLGLAAKLQSFVCGFLVDKGRRDSHNGATVAASNTRLLVLKKNTG